MVGSTFDEKKTNLLEHACTLGDLGKDVVVEECLAQNNDSLGFALDTKLLGLDVDLDRIDVVNAILLGGLVENPGTKLVVDSIATGLAVLIVTEAELLLELIGELSLTGLDGLLAHIHSPVIILNLDFRGSRLHLFKFVVAAMVVAVSARSIVGSIFTTRGIAVGLLATVLLLGTASSFLGSLVLLAALALVLCDETTQLQADINIGALTTSLAVEQDARIEDNEVGFRVEALLAENELLDEAIEELLQLAGFVGTVDDPSVVLGISVGLGTKLEGKVLDDIVGVTSKRLGNRGQVDNNSLDTVSFSFNLGLETLHLVAIEGVTDVAANVD